MKQESTFYTRELTALTRNAWKTRAKSIAVARQKYSTDISEEYGYSHEKKHTDARSKAHKMWLN